MKFETKEMQFFNGCLMLPIAPYYKEQVEKLLKDLQDGKTLDVSIEPHRKHRSLNANAYAWVLMQKLAEKLSASGVYHSKEEIYRRLIKDSQPFGHMPVDDDEETISYVIRTWQSRGVGWVAENIGKTKTMPGKVCIALYKGSSQYNTKEMSRLINAIADECQMQGIETMPQDELDSLIDSWQPKERE